MTRLNATRTDPKDRVKLPVSDKPSMIAPTKNVRKPDSNITFQCRPVAWTVTGAIGNAQPGHDVAKSDMARPHSGHEIIIRCER